MCATHASRSTMLHAKERECSKGLIFRSYAKENQPTRNQHIIRKDGYGIDANCNHAAGARTSTLSFDRFEFGYPSALRWVAKAIASMTGPSMGHGMAGSLVPRVYRSAGWRCVGTQRDHGFDVPKALRSSTLATYDEEWPLRMA